MAVKYSCMSAVAHHYLSLSICLCSTILIAEPDYRIAVGETVELVFPLDSQIELSKKGVLDMYYQNAGKWTATALRPGVAVIKAYSREQYGSRRVLVEVLDEKKLQGLPKWLCSTKGVQCSNGRIFGEVQSESWMNKARKIAEARKDFIFDVRLVGMVTIYFFIEVMRKQKFERNGANADIAQRMQWNQIPNLNMELTYEPHKKDLKGQILSMPKIRSKIFEPFSLRIGGEQIFVNASSENIKSHNTGLEITGNVQPSGQKYQMKYDLVVRSASSQRSQYNVNKMQSTVELAACDKAFLGTVGLVSQIDSRLQDFFAKIPIISPLFRRVDASHSNQELNVFAAVGNNCEAKIR